MKKILFRVDAGGKVGLGHFYRSYSLAKALTKSNFEIKFVYIKSSFWSDVIKTFEFDTFALSADNANEEMVDLCVKEQVDILYVDGIISFLKENLDRLPKRCKVVFYQNISDSKHLSDVYILPSIHQTVSFFKKFDNQKTQIFQGLKYFTFNEKISKLPVKEVQLKSEVNKIGIICGGSDPKNVMMTLYKLIDFEKNKNISFSFFYGVNYMHKNTLPSKEIKNVSFLPFEMHQINSCDFLIAAFGVSTYEFMALGMPIISLGHQKSNAEASKVLSNETKSVYHLGVIDELTKKEVNFAIQTLVNNSEKRKLLSDNSKKNIDLKGIERIKKIIESI